ncbi:NRDE protein-domain-containing protein [Xylariaceae sp. FL0255]|nr:NRDE protein-domain-containing protein [Xylariaceae sp. FL0255]
MCIALLSTAHPRYALIAIDNRDEYILRPTSRPYWWTHEPSGSRILSARDLHRRERGTWMGVSSTGRIAILTNYRESAEDDPNHAISGIRSRGALPMAWLGGPTDEDLDTFVKKMVDDPATKAVGGFSLICGDLNARDQKTIKPLAIISNRCDKPVEVPRIAGERGSTYGLSNTVYVEPCTWPKVKNGTKLLSEAIQDAIDRDPNEEDLTARLFEVLENDTFPSGPDSSMQDNMNLLRQSIYIPGFSDDEGWKYMAEARAKGRGKAPFDDVTDDDQPDKRPQKDPTINFLKGAYGTQRQTLVLVDWDGNVTYTERAIWDSHGNKIEKGQGDQIIRYKIEG